MTDDNVVNVTSNDVTVGGEEDVDDDYDSYVPRSLCSRSCIWNNREFSNQVRSKPKEQR